MDHPEKLQGRGFETSFPTPMAEGRRMRESGIVMGGPVNTIVSPGFWDRVESGGGFTADRNMLSGLTMIAAATIAFALAGERASQELPERRSAAQVLSTALSDGAVIVATLRAFCEVRRFVGLSRESGKAMG
jgi:hypothetical protein